MKFVTIIGRWNTLHLGHRTVIESFLNNEQPVSILVRDTPINDKDPFSAIKRKEQIEEYYRDEVENGTLIATIIPDVLGVALGRGIGYWILSVPDKIKEISATKARKELVKVKEKGFVLWFVGYSSAGKTTLAKELVKLYEKQGRVVHLLDGDIIRNLNSDKDFTPRGRTNHINKVRELADFMSRDGAIVIVSCITPYSQMRDLNRLVLGSRYYEIFVNCDLVECMRRDRELEKNIYLLKENVTGIHDVFNKPTISHIEIETDRETVEKSVEILTFFLKTNKLL